jgi:pyruvate kinase
MPEFLPRTKIVATLGPASQTEATIRGLAEAGVSVFRLNSAHGEPAWHDRMAQLVRQVADQIGRPLAILQDLSGPKWRLGDLPGGSLLLQLGQRVRLLRHPSGQADELTCNYPQLLDQLEPGMNLLVADGTVALRVVARLDDGVELQVVVPGEIRSRQGIAAPGLSPSLSALTEKDVQDLEAAARRQVDYIGLSFVGTAEDVQRLRQEMHRLRLEAGIVAKIERAAALRHLDAIIRLSDAIMVARGDLGVEVELSRVPLLQKEIIARCRALGKPVITATQMLESMRQSNRPTRAEVSDVANAILDGTDAVMLSAETASGQYPIEAVLTMRRIAEATEAALPSGTFSDALTEMAASGEMLPVIAQVAGQLADRVHAKILVVATHGGHSALALSKQRFLTPILGFSNRLDTVRKMCLYWGVIPIHCAEPVTPATFLPQTLRWLNEHGWTKPGDRLVLMLGAHWSGNGCHSLLLYQV